jgi:alkylhydroperoxidase family enzyme
MSLTIHDADTAPEASRAMVAASSARYGFLPNLHGIMAGSPVMYEAYQAIGQTYGRSRMSVLERQVVLQSINFENECHYCMAAHSLIATKERMPAEILTALREGTPLADPKLQVLREFAALMTRQRGWVTSTDVQAFHDAGYTQENLLEVIVAIAYKVMSNYINHIAETPLDAAFQPFAWQHPSERAAAA